MARLRRRGTDFNPAADRIRLVNSAKQNFRLNPKDATLTTDTNLAFAAGDPNVAASPVVTGISYDQNFAGTPTTTLFGIDFTTDHLVRIGGVAVVVSLMVLDWLEDGLLLSAVGCRSDDRLAHPGLVRWARYSTRAKKIALILAGIVALSGSIRIAIT